VPLPQKVSLPKEVSDELYGLLALPQVALTVWFAEQGAFAPLLVPLHVHDQPLPV
jgi:hypothetical protein